MATTAFHASAARRREPSWWNDQHSRAWERVRDAFARDWEETSEDVAVARTRGLDSSAASQSQHMTGMNPIKADAVTDNHRSYSEAEPALRYGYGASTYYFDHDVWDASLEAKLRDDWSEVDDERNWKTVRDQVRAGWERARGTRH